MRIIYTISKEEEKAEVRATVKDKQVDKHSHAVELRVKGKSNHKIAENLYTSAKVLIYWMGLYKHSGIETLKGKKREGHNWNINYE